MLIQERNVEAVKYGKDPYVVVFVRQKKGDCRLDVDSNYICYNNCDGNYAILIFLDKHPQLVYGLVQEWFHFYRSFPDTATINDLSALERLAMLDGYSKRRDGKDEILYFSKENAVRYVPCGLFTDKKRFYPEIRSTISELYSRTDALYDIVQKKPARSVVEIPPFREHLFDVGFEERISRKYGFGGTIGLNRLQNSALGRQRRKNKTAISKKS